mmetsp:Transcript_28686/g.91921  ORF Transcript_28686/g.91921 Transcript_28686/m.91921 type:complete len:316 (-) Transcript_28686:2058-3005(-)
MARRGVGGAADHARLLCGAVELRRGPGDDVGDVEHRHLHHLLGHHLPWLALLPERAVVGQKVARRAALHCGRRAAAAGRPRALRPGPVVGRRPDLLALRPLLLCVRPPRPRPRPRPSSVLLLPRRLCAPARRPGGRAAAALLARLRAALLGLLQPRGALAPPPHRPARQRPLPVLLGAGRPPHVSDRRHRRPRSHHPALGGVRPPPRPLGGAVAVRRLRRCRRRLPPRQPRPPRGQGGAGGRQRGAPVGDAPGGGGRRRAPMTPPHTLLGHRAPPPPGYALARVATPQRDHECGYIYYPPLIYTSRVHRRSSIKL